MAVPQSESLVRDLCISGLLTFDSSSTGLLVETFKLCCDPVFSVNLNLVAKSWSLSLTLKRDSDPAASVYPVRWREALRVHCQ